MSFLINPYVYAGFDPDAQAFITAAGITDTTQQNAINTLVLDLKGYGIWSKMKAIYPFVGGTASTHKWNLKDPRDLDAAFRLVFTGGWTHSNTGALPNGTNGYADTKLIPSIDLTLNNTSTSIYSRTNNSGNFCDIGSENSSTQRLLMLTKWSNLDGFHDFYDASNGRLTFIMSLTNSTGLFLANRTANNLMNLWRNSSKLSTKTTLITSILPTRSIYLSAQNSITVSNYSTRELAFASIGLGLTDTEAANFYTAVQAYQTTLGRSIGPQTVSDPDAQAFVTAANIQDQVQADAVNNLTIGLKADGLWSKMKAIYPFVGGDATSHKFNLKNPLDTDAAFRLVFNGGWTHSANGVKPNGTNAYADTKLIPNTILDVNSTHASIYSRTNLTSGTAVDLGCFSGGTSIIDLYSRFSSNNMLSRAYNTTYLSGAVSDSLGLFIVNRQSSNLIKQHKNSSIIASNSLVAGTKPTVILSLGALNNSGSFTGTYSSREYAFSTIGDGLTDTDAANLYSRVQTFQTTLGRQVI